MKHRLYALARRMLLRLLRVVKEPTPVVATVMPQPPKQRINLGRERVKRFGKKSCISTGKLCRTEVGAKEKARRDNDKVQGGLRAYCCPFCNAWHVTHKKNKLSFH